MTFGYRKPKELETMPLRVHKSFNEEVKEIMRERIAKGIDDPFSKKPTWRITQGIVRHSDWERIKRDIARAELPDIREDDHDF